MTSENQPTVSVIIPTYNDAEYLPRALDSVLAQTQSSFEVLIVDDGSTDNTCEVISDQIERENVRYIRHSLNRGGGAARNTGIMIAKGEYIAFLDADDTWRPTKLERQITYLEEHPQYGASYCGVHHPRRFKALRTILSKIFISEDKASGVSGGEELIPTILNMDFSLGGTSTLVVRRSLAERLGGFDPHFERHQDWEFLIRLLKESSIAYIDQELVTKYKTPSPGAETVRIAKERYFNKFEEEINSYEEQGISIRETHKFDLARRYFQEGNLVEGVQYLTEVHLDRSRIIIVVWSLYFGVLNSLRKIANVR